MPDPESFDILDCPADGDIVTCPNCLAKAWLWQVPRGKKVTLFCNGSTHERGRHVFQVEGAMMVEDSALLAVTRLGYALHNLRSEIAEAFRPVFRLWRRNDD